MSQICTLSHSATTDTAGPHPLTTGCMGYEAKKWEMRLARVTAARDEALDSLADTFPRSWDGLMAFVDYQYPRDIFTESDDQPGSRIVWLLRQLATVEAERDALQAKVDAAAAIHTMCPCGDGDHCNICDVLTWPCQTLAILEGDTE